MKKIFISAILGLYACMAYASPDSLKNVRRSVYPIHTGLINSDRYVDTLIATGDRQLRYVPSEIRWGRKNPGNHQDTSEQPRHKQTKIKFPNWDKAGYSVAFERHNGDTLSDLVFYYWGVKKKHNGDSSCFNIIALYGQSGLDTVEEVELNIIDSVQYSPFHARRLSLANDYRDPAIRQLDGSVSYIIKRTPETPDTVLSNIPQPEQRKTVFRIYPNPADEMLQVEVAGLPAGDYNIDILTIEGKPALRRGIRITGENSIHNLEPGLLASGSYMLVLHGSTITLGPLLFIITH